MMTDCGWRKLFDSDFFPLKIYFDHVLESLQTVPSPIVHWITFAINIGIRVVETKFIKNGIFQDQIVGIVRMDAVQDYIF